MTNHITQQDAQSRAAQRQKDLEAEGEPEKEFRPGIASRIPAKTVAAGAIIRDPEGRILFVTPVYKPTLEIPGGVVDANESPREACERELREELGLEIPLRGPLVVDWVSAQGVWRDSLQLIFDGGALNQEQISRIELPPDELQSYQFFHLKDVQRLFKPAQYRRLQQAIEALQTGQPRHTDFGRP
ncbi:NUDIX hydrolase [Thermocrispum sp.]|uniref:NUDIX domain-containing protein n=1 Tax=Thermocrispum sp. TaxID=2060768 RepID=UPI002580A7A1|nr:NUDIX hydrolase [Thermocrispum sp.]